MPSSILLSLLLAIAFFGTGNGVFTEFLKHFGLVYECPSGWSSWSQCINTDVRNILRSLPHTCRVSGVGATLRRANVAINPILKYYNKLNVTSRPCGMCLKEIKCSNDCVNQTPGVVRLTKPFGIRERFCEGIDQSYACAVDSSVVNPVTGNCEVWPPKDDILPLLIPHKIKTLVYAVPLLNCISVDRKCYCCCHPYKPDPCTAKCVTKPCTDQTVLVNGHYNQLRG